ncbi:MAG TPA: hypothetical protein VND93_01905 [Myxococcales bacterium]|nr:hypothetical protein [Myxococcales bacterium]
MKLLGKDFDGKELLDRIEERLRARGLSFEPPAPIRMDGPEPRVDPLSFNLHALEEHADSARPMPLHTHRGGLGQAVLLAKWAFRKTCQVLINETLARQRVFNGHVRDAYAQLSAEVIRLRERVEALEPEAKSKPPPRRRKPRGSP